jgi:hypothetical protein
MKPGRLRFRGSRALSLTLAMLGLLGLIRQPASAQSGGGSATPAPAAADPIERKAMDTLKAACDVLAGAKAMSFTATSTYEKAARNGQPLYYAVQNRVTMQRPDKLRVITPGDRIPDAFYYDGKSVMAYVPSAEVVAIASAPPTIDDMVDFVWNAAAIYFPFVDVILSRPCDVFEHEGLNSAFYVGQSHVVGDTVTDMVAVAADNVQAELWIGVQDHLPRMVRVVYPHEPAHALYQTEYTDWKLMEAAEPGAFTTNKAEKAQRIPFQPPGTTATAPNTAPTRP